MTDTSPATRSSVPLILAALTAACASAPTETVDVRSLSPACGILAIGPVALPQTPATVGETPATTEDGSHMSLAANAEELRRMLAQDLIRLGAATDVVLADDAKHALDRGADFYIKPEVSRSVSFTPDGISDNWLGCGALFLTTWIGGLLVNDYRYDSNLQLSYDMFKPADAGEQPIDSRETSTSGLIDLAFLDRNDFFSWSTAQSLVLFPFWTSDDEEGTRSALTAAAVRSTAEDLATYLQRDMEKSWPVAILESSDQRNSDRRKRGGLRVVEGRQIELFVAAREPIERCEATLRAGNEAKATTVTIVSKQPQQQRSEITASQPGFEFGTRVRIDVPELGDGPVDLRLTITARSTVTRTLRLFRDAASYDAYAKDPKRLELGSPAAASASQ